MSNNYLFGTGNQFVVKPFPMNDLPKIIGDNVRRFRERADMSQADLARAIGVKSQNTIATLELGGGSKHLAKIAKALKVRLADLDPTYDGEESVIVPSSAPASELVAVFASVEGGKGELVLSNEPYTRLAMPKALIGVKRGYGVLVRGESMVPLVRPGYTVWVNPHLPPRASDICLFFLEADGEFTATIKEYFGQTADSWLVKRYQPKERKLSLPKREWPGCHVVVGTDYGR